ncbi:MAG TPA: ABC transporter substrate-binding protein [Acidimicrobiales bacterium]|nr:ABC transporter substrate-binding protein [Acidimicrobiales bacterium]
MVTEQCRDAGRDGATTVHRRRSGVWRALALLVTLVVLAAACGGDDDSADGPDQAAVADPNGVLKVGLNIPSELLKLDYRFAYNNSQGEIHYQLNSPLVRYDTETKAYEPYLAESFEINDPKTVTITIRSDALFHDGRPVTAADAKASIESARKASEDGDNALNAAIQSVASVDVVNERTFRVTLDAPGLGALYELLVGREFFIIPAGAGADQEARPIGTGPFKFVSYEPGQRLVLGRFDEHFDADNIGLKGIEFINVNRGTAQVNALLSGDIDFAPEVSDAGSAAALESHDEIAQLVRPDDTNFLHMQMCMADGHFWDDVRVRQAIMYGTDRQQILDALFGGDGEVMNQLWPESSPEYDADLADRYPYDPDKARDLLEDAGVPEGTRVGILAVSTVAAAEPTSLILKDQWADIGLDVEVVQTDDITADFLAAQTAPFAPREDATVLTNSRSGTQKLTRYMVDGGTANACPFSDPDLQRLGGDLVGLAPDDPEAIETWQEASKLVLEDARWLFIAWIPTYVGWNEDVVGGMTPERNRQTIAGTRFELLTVNA